jgi:hypothetical protein
VLAIVGLIPKLLVGGAGGGFSLGGEGDACYSGVGT